MADESVVVSKARPVKASNGVEDKTELTISMKSGGVLSRQKCLILRREEAYFKSVMNRYFFSGVHKSTYNRSLFKLVTLGVRLWPKKLYKGVALSRLVDCHCARTLSSKVK